MNRIAEALVRSRAARRIVMLASLCSAMAACPLLPTGPDPRIEDPCYSATMWLDTVSMAVDSVSWEWTPGVCG